MLSRESGGLRMACSSLKPAVPGGTNDVGDGSTSVSRCGGPLCESLFHIVFPHGNEALFECPRGRVEVEEAAIPDAFQGAWSTDPAAVPGLTGENGPLPSEGLRVIPC